MRLWLAVYAGHPESHKATGPESELREITIGMTGKLRIVVASHVTDDGTIRIISARKASSHEIRYYSEG